MEFAELFGIFGDVFGSTEGVRVFSAPGRVNLIGEHIDYCGGRVFPAALSLSNTVLARRNSTRKVRMYATDLKIKAEFDLDEIQMKPVDSLSAYSSRRITIGSIRDETFGLTRRGCAVTLVPVLDTVDYGTSPVFKKMVFRAAVDSISVPDDSQKNILQNINVYALNKPVDSKEYYSRTKLDYGSQRVTKGVPVANGTDSLAFEFTTEFGERYLGITQEDLEDFDQYCSKFPGIYITTDDPVGNGGRFDMYKMDILEKEQGYLNRTNNYAILYYSGIYDGERKDSTLMFYFSPREFQDLDSLISASSIPDQYVFNVDYHESDGMAGTASDKIYIEGGSGLKPVIPAKELWRLANGEIARKGGNGKTALISKATIELPFDMPEDYGSMHLYPLMLSPTVCIKTDTTVSFAGLTDASATDENQGDINRSLFNYAPDITHHVQQIIRKDADEDLSNYDIWMLIMGKVTTTTTNSSASQMADYYQQLAYYSYYNQLYGGGGYYGGGYYGGGYYGNSYSNYYNFMLMAQYAGANASSTTTSWELDKDCYYNCYLHGPASADRKPKLKITFALPKE